MTDRLPLRTHPIIAAASRISLVLALLSAPMLALAEPDRPSGLLVGADVERSSGAGLVIVVSLQRAR